MELQQLIEILTGLTGTAYKMPEGEITALLQAENATPATVLEALRAKDQARVTELTKSQTNFQEAYNKAKGEVMTQFERQLREKFNIAEADLQGIQLVERIVADKAAKGELTEEQVKLHPAYRALEANSKKALKDKDTEWQTKFEEQEAAASKRSSQAAAHDAIRKALTALNPVLSTNATIASNQMAAFVKSFEADGYEFKLLENGTVQPMKDGKPVDDGHGYSVSIEDLTKKHAAGWFDFQQNNGGSNAGNSNEGEGNQNKNDAEHGGYPATVGKPKDYAELQAKLRDKSIPYADRLRASEVWNEQNADAKP